MIDLKQIRENRSKIEKELKKKAFPINLDHLVEIDETRVRLIKEVDELRTQRNEAAKARDIEKGKEIKTKLEKAEHSLGAVEQEFKKELYKVPNPPLSDVPVGDETKNEVIKTYNEPKKFNFLPKSHVELGEALGIIDIPRAAKVSGSRFAYLKGDGVLLELALVQYALKKLTKEGFEPIFPPVLIKQEITEDLGYWQVGANENYYLVSDFEKQNEVDQEVQNNLYLIGTGEHAVVPMHKNETFTQESLPRKYAAFSSCFRRESGSYGKDTQGILRVHQFDKVEMVSFVKPEEDEKERRKMLEIAEGLMKDLALPHRVVKLATGDLSFPSAETVDIETWIPSQNKYRETHSISTTTHFQAKRLGIKYQRSLHSGESQKEKGEKSFVHILNGTAFAIGRTIIAILENYQKEDGTVEVPEVLREYLGKDTLVGK